MPQLLLQLLAALIQVGGQPLSGGNVSGSAMLPLERAAGGETPVLTLSTPQGPVRLLLDTGASSTMVTPALVARLALTSSALSPEAFTLAGGGSGCEGLRPRRTRLPPLELGATAGGERLRLQEVEALVLPVGALPPGLDGVLGAPTLRRQPLWIDPLSAQVAFGAAALRASRTAPGGTGSAAATAATTPPPQRLRLPLRWQRGVPLLPLRTPQGPVPALADTGAEGLFLSQGLARRLPPGGPERSLTLVGFCGAQQVVQRSIAGLGLGPTAPTTPARAGRSDVAAEASAIILTNPIFEALDVEAIVGQELLRHRRQLWRLDLQPPQLELR